MTHARFRQRNPAPPGVVLEPTECPGRLVVRSEHHDAASDRRVKILVCTDCGATVVFEPGPDHRRGQVRNDYHPPETYAEMVARLADRSKER